MYDRVLDSYCQATPNSLPDKHRHTRQDDGSTSLENKIGFPSVLKMQTDYR